MQTILEALQKSDYIKSVVPVMDGSKEVGYAITFASGKNITVYHGKDGVNGTDGINGTDGKDAVAPVIGVAKDEDGVRILPGPLPPEWEHILCRNLLQDRLPAGSHPGDCLQEAML